MSNLERIAEIAKSAEQVLLPNRYPEPFVDAYQQITGFEVPSKPDRKLKAESNGITYRWLRGRDVPVYLEPIAKELDGPTIGFTGYEWFLEADANRQQPSPNYYRVGESLGQIALIAPIDSDINGLTEKLEARNEPIEVVSAYRNLENWADWLNGYNPVTRFAVSGCAESAADSLAMPAVDLVSSGRTIEINGFQVLVPLLESFPVMLSTIKY